MTKKIVDLLQDENLCIKLRNIIRKVQDAFEPGNVGDTLQGFQHFETVDKNLATLVVELNNVDRMSDTELFLLGASAYLHDLFKPSLAWGTLTHGGKVMKAVSDKPELYGLDDRAEVIPVGFISAAHSSRSLDNTEWDRVPEKHGMDIELRKICALFLLADTLDTTSQRAPEMMRHIHYPEGFTDEETEGKWMGRQAITTWYLKDGKVVLQAYPKSSEERETALRAKTMMEEDLSEVKPTLRSLKIPCELDLEISDIFLKEKAIVEIHEAAPFKGMDFYDERDRSLFKGRKDDREHIEGHLYAYPITLLAGNSGVGKTSLIRACLFPVLKESGWVCIYLRPFTDPTKMVESIKRMYGVEAASLTDAFRKLLEKLKKKILVVIDQFEDVLNWHAELVKEFIYDLSSIHGLGNPKLLIALRSDALIDLNIKLFKKVMPSGFPTVELGGLSKEGAREALKTGFAAGKITLHPPELLDEIPNDLIELGPFDEIYPPYLQMVGEVLFKRADKSRKLVSRDLYYELGRAKGIVATYLVSKLEEFGEGKDKAIKILKFLVSSRGRKAPQKSVSEIATEIGIAKTELKELLRRLVDARMVRKLAGAHYEIIHDHFGTLINEAFVGAEERRIKYLREQLNAAIDAFDRNNALMQGEILAELYLSREKIAVDESAYPVLLATWCAHEFPVWYWLKNVGNKKNIAMTIELCGHPKEEVKEGASKLLATALMTLGDKNEARKLFAHENRAVRRAAVEAISKLGSREDLLLVKELLNDGDREVRRAALQVISTLGSREDLPDVRELLNDENWEVRRAAVEATLKLVSREDLPLIALLRDKEEDVRRAAIKAFSRLVSREDLPLMRELLKDKFRYVRMAAVQAIATLESREDLPLVRERLNDKARDVRKAALQAISTLGSREDLPLVGELLNDEAREVQKAALEAFFKLVSREGLPEVRVLLKDENWYVRMAAVQAIATLESREDLPLVRALFNDEDSAVRSAALEAFSKLVSREDLPKVRELLNGEDWEFRKAAVQAISTLGSRKDLPLVRALLNDADWYVRMAALEAVFKLVNREDLPVVKELLKDEYEYVRMAAVKAITDLAGGEDLEDLAKLAVESGGAIKEPMNALGMLDWKVFSPYPLRRSKN